MSLAIAATNQLQVVHALVLRETRTRFGAHQLGYLWALLEPCLWILTFYAMYQLAGRRAPTGMGMIAFISTGLIPFLLATRTAERATAAISANKALLFYPQVRPLDLVIARSTLEAVTLILVMVCLLSAGAALEGATRVDDLLRVLTGLGLASALGFSLGLFFCCAAVYSPAIERVRGPLFRPLFWTSGVFFTADGLPSQVRDLLLYNPVLHVVELVRGGWFPSYAGAGASPWYVLAWILPTLWLGLALERICRRRIEVT